MANEFKYKARVGSDGKLEKVYSARAFKNDLALFRDCDIEISFKKWKKPRSDKQRRFYFGNYVESQIECFKERWGGHYTKEQIHDWNKSNIFCEEMLLNDEIIKVPKSTEDYSPMEFEDRLELGRIYFMQTFEWQLPYPLQQSELDL